MGKRKEYTKKIVTTADGSQYVEYYPVNVEELLKIREDMEALRNRPHTFADVAKLTRRLSVTAAKLGGYYLAAPEDLLTAGENYFHEHAEQVRAALEQGGADAETIAAVLNDYGAALCGMCEYRATAQQMENALKSCGPAVAYSIDKYGLYIGLLYCYQRNLNTLAEYQREVKQEPDATKRDLFFMASVSAGEFNDLHAAALLWLQNTGFITASDFAGIDTPTIQNFLSYIDLYGNNGQFVQYVYTARHALNATREQLEQLQPPPLFSRARISPIRAALDWADAIGEEINVYLERVAEQIEAPAPQERAETFPAVEVPERPADYNGGVFKPSTPEPEAADAPAIQNGIIEITNPLKLGGRISFSEDCALILSRPLYASVTGPTAREILPISAFIADFAAHNPDAMKVTPGVLEKTVEAVNLLQQLKRTTPANGIYTLKTNLTEFSELYGYTDANEQQKQEILTALHVLHNLYIVVWKPTGRVAVQLFGLQQYGLAGGTGERELILNVFASGFRGRPQFWNAQQYALIRKKEKGAAMRRFRNQIISKQHAHEELLLLQIFGYDTIREDAGKTNDAAQIAAAEEYIRKHKSRDKKRLRGYFDDWARQGYITYSVRVNKKGELIYSWHRLPACPQEPENENE